MLSGDLLQERVDVGDRTLRVLRAGRGAAVVLLHGGTAGWTEYSGSAEIWEPWISHLAATHEVLAFDMPGSGESRVESLTDLTVAGSAELIGRALAALDVPDVHVVGHAESSLVALKLAREGFAGRRVLSCTLIAANEAAPTGDGIEDIALLHPPASATAVACYGWALDRLSWSPDHISPELLGRLAEHAAGSAHRHALELLAAQADRRPRRADVAAAKAELFEYCRAQGYSVPIAAVWGADDPTTTLTHGHELLRFLSTGPASVTFHVMNRTGHFPFREDPGLLTRILLPTLTAQG
jgi:2-hydroxy-6-oxonona-2,4-dienedioate hydrolase